MLKYYATIEVKLKLRDGDDHNDLINTMKITMMMMMIIIVLLRAISMILMMIIMIMNIK